MKKIIISDVTLRDGNHAVNHALSSKIIEEYCDQAENNKMDVVEVGHGNGLGASSLAIGRSVISDSKMLKTARKRLKKSKLSVHSIPGFSKIRDLNMAIDHGVDIVREGCNSTESDIIEKQVEFCKRKNTEVWGVLMMFHLIKSKKIYMEKIKFLKKIGLKKIIIMDSAGCLYPEEIKNIFNNLKKYNFETGIHAHNNLGFAMANSLIAVQNGCKIVDLSIRGFGAGAGNTQLETFLTILDQKKLIPKLNLESIYKMSDIFPKILLKNKINHKEVFSETINILTARYGLFSGFSSHIRKFCDSMNLDKIEACKFVGKKKLVAGQEDLLMNILTNLKNEKN